MTQEDKDLLFRDLCGRLPYGVKFKWCDNFHTDCYYTLISINKGQIIGRNVNQEDCLFFRGEDKIKPYLRLMSSMTKEEKHNYFMTYTSINGVDIPHPYKTQDWLNANHFDFRGLIPKGLALSTDEFNPYKD